VFRVVAVTVRLAAAVIGGMFAGIAGLIIGEVGRSSEYSTVQVPRWGPVFAAVMGLVGGVIGWRLSRWMTREVTDGRSDTHGSAGQAWLFTIQTAVGVSLPVLAIPALLSCSDECHGFAFLVPLGGLIAVLGMSLLAYSADDASVGPRSSPWVALTKKGWPNTMVGKAAVVAVGFALTLLFLDALAVHPLMGVWWSIGLVWLGVCLAGWVRLDAVSRRSIWKDERALVVDFRAVVFALLLVVAVDAILVLIAWVPLFGRF